MPFDTLSERLRHVAERCLAHSKQRYGSNGLKIEEGISDSILWRPTFYMKVGKHKIVAIEVEDVLYPSSLKGAAHEITNFDFPIAVYQACTLEAFQKDPGQENINKLKGYGFGIMTVDEAGYVAIQHPCGALAQNISPSTFENAIGTLNNKLRIAFRSAYSVYSSDQEQGLQKASQIVESIVDCLAAAASKKILDINIAPDIALADKIDKLYAHNSFRQHRAALGGARDFIKEFRNVASHAPRSAKDAADRIRKCRRGFLDAIAIALKLKMVFKALGYTIKVHIA